MPSTTKPLLSAAFLTLVALLTSGCQNQQSVASNPFATADRVPPPATRIPAAPAAQPYYQGAANAAPPPATFAAEVQATPIPVAAPPATFAAGEATICLPTDNQPLRLGPPAEQGPPAQFAATPSAAATTLSVAEPAQTPTSPEFSPLAAPTQLAWGGGTPPAAPAAGPVVYEPAPRVRLPGYATPVSYEAPSAAQPAAGPIGTVQITELPQPQHQQPASLPAGPAGDGFQARGASPRGAPTPLTPRVY